MRAAMWLGALLTLGSVPRRKRASYSGPVVSAPGQPTEATVSYIGGDFILGVTGGHMVLYAGPGLESPSACAAGSGRVGGPGRQDGMEARG